jgi:photosystem II stability/assembly factor-like uncharacterized protein
MKIKIHKLLAVALTVVLLASLTVGLAASPAAADELEWSKKNLTKVGEDGDYFRNEPNVFEIQHLGPMAKAIDGTLYLGAVVDVDNDGDKAIDGTDYWLFKSTDSGRKWSKTDYDEDEDTFADGGGQIYAMEASSIDADILYVADEDQVIWKTTDGGDKFSEMASMSAVAAAGERITGIDVGYIDDDNAVVFVSTTTDGGAGGDVYSLNEEDYPGTWGAFDIATDRATGNDFAGTTADVWDIAVSPDFDDDRMIIAVVTDITGGETYTSTKYGSGQWDADTDYMRLDPDGAATEVDDVYFATIWLPGDFESDTEGNHEFFVGIASSDPLEGDVYKIIAGADDPFDRDVPGSNEAFNVTGLDGTGDAGSAYLLVVGNEADDLDAPMAYYSDDNGSGWDDCKKEPTGGTYSVPGADQALVSVVVADDYADSGEAWAATVGTECAVSFTRDYGKLFNQISLIATDYDTTNDHIVSPDGDLKFLATSGSGDDSLWMYVDGKWERTALEEDIDLVAFSPEFDSDETVFFADADDPEISRSTDGGFRFRSQDGDPDNPISSWVIIDKNTVIVGFEGGDTQKTTRNGTTWKDVADAGTDHITSMALSPDFDADETIMLGTDDGEVYISFDAGDEWEEDSGNGDGPTFVAFDPDYANNGISYAASEDDGELVVDRFDGDDWFSIYPGDDSDYIRAADWDPDDVDAGEETDGATGLALGPDGTMYISDAGIKGMMRCLDPRKSNEDKVEWEQVSEEFSDVNLATIMVSSGSNLIFGIEGDNDNQAIWTYEDTLNVPAVLSSPSDGSSTGRVDSATISWNKLDGADDYEIRVDTDPGFKGESYDPADTSLTNVRVTGLEDGRTYYWKVRVAAGEPVLSKWSDVWSFTTQMSAAQWNPFVGGIPEAPYNGATNVPLQPSFAWNAADWATGYEFVLAKDAAYKDVVASKTGANALTGTVYLSEQKLDNSTTYYWKVRAISKTTNSEWAQAVFTTEGKAPAPPAPPAPVKPPPAPEPVLTQAIVWTIIGIGAILAIAVIILIIRTRRVP